MRSLSTFRCRQLQSMFVASITISNRDENMKSRLRVRAAGDGRNMEEEACFISGNVVGR